MGSQEILAQIAAVCFGLAFSRLGVLGSVITIHALVWEMVWEFEVFGAVDFFFFNLKRTARFTFTGEIAKGIGQAEYASSGHVVLKSLCVWICCLLLWSCEHWKLHRKKTHASHSSEVMFWAENQGSIYSLTHHSSPPLPDIAPIHIGRRQFCLFWFCDLVYGCILALFIITICSGELKYRLHLCSLVAFKQRYMSEFV